MIVYLLSTRVVGNFLLLPLEEPFNHKHQPQQVDAMVILSGGTYGKSANLTLGHSSFKRLVYGLMIAKKESIAIIYSGKGIGKYDESQSAKDTIDELNNYFELTLKESKKLTKGEFSILFEQKSLNTYENAKYTKTLFEQNGIKNPTIYLVTSAYHMKRSKTLYEYYGFEVIPVATDFLTKEKINIDDLFPSMTALLCSYHALHEYIGIAVLSLKLK